MIEGPEILEHCDTDAMKWAEMLKQMCKENLIMEPQNDEGYMVGWFANAMCMQQEAERTKHEEIEIQTLGLLSSLLASRADAWNGNAPDWFPQPGEWLELWQKAKQVATADEQASDYKDLVKALSDESSS